jgi:acetamidase/formamidase
MKTNCLLRAAFGLVLVSVAALPLQAAPLTPDHHLGAKPANMIWGYFSADTPPVLKIKDGETVSVDTTDLTGISPEKPEQFFIDHNLPLDLPAIQDLIAIKKEVKPTGIRGHMMTGPIYIEGAEPGDTLEVRVLDVKTRVPYAMNQMRPGGGGIPDLVPRPFAKFIPLDLEHQVANFTDKIKVPLKPFQGVMAVAPTAERGKLPSGPPYADIGGNFDNKDLGKGATVYFPVQVKGALFHVGDPHAVQGDGEVDGGAAESSNTVTLQFIVRKDLHIKTVRAETPTYYMIMGLDVELSTAMHKAIAGSVEFLQETQGIDFFQALSLCSIGVDFRVTEVVDTTKGIHAMIPKSFFQDGKTAANTYWYKEEPAFAASH